MVACGSPDKTEWSIFLHYWWKWSANTF